MNKTKQLISSYIILLSTGSALVLYGYLGSFTRLLADDYCSAYYAQRLGLLRSIWYWYLNWSGRYTAFGADWLMEKLGVYNLKVIPPFSLLFWLVMTICAIYLSLKRHIQLKDVRLASISLGAVFLYVVLSLSPNIPQSVFWWNGMRSYSLPLILLTTYVVLFQLGVERLRTKREIIIGGLLSFLYAFMSGGTGETYVAFQVVLFGFLIILLWFVQANLKSSQFVFLLAGFVGSVVAILVVISAPGNAIRQSYFPPPPGIAALTAISLHGYWDFILQIIQSPAKISGLIGALCLAAMIGARSQNSQMRNYRLVPMLLVGAFVLALACIVPGVYATSEPPPTRAMIIPVFGFVACLLWAGFMIGQQNSNQINVSGLTGDMLVFAIALLIAYSALTTSQSLYNDQGVYSDFAQKWDETDVLILKAKADNLESVQIPAMDNWAGLERPTPKKIYWPNVCYSLYYDIQVYGPRYSEE